jgi:sec-independent protein translocase protein TatA
MGLENPIHIILLLMVLLLVFGAKRLPEMGRGLGDGLRGFKDAVSGQTPAQTITPHVAHDAHLDAAVTTPVVVSEPVAVPVPVSVD